MIYVTIFPCILGLSSDHDILERTRKSLETGMKAAKIITLMVLLTVPVVGQVLGVYLISQLMLSAIGIFEVTKEKLLLPAPIK